MRSSMAIWSCKPYYNGIKVILGIDDALNKAVVARKEIGAVVLDQDLPGVKLETVLLTQREHRPFRLRRNVKERVHLERGVDGEMLLRERFLEIHRERLIKFFVVFLQIGRAHV